jgi:hypothetical protein
LKGLRKGCEDLVVKKSMWRCSGQHWLNTAFAWSLAGLAIGVIGELSALDAAEKAELGTTVTAMSAPRLNFAGEGAAMALKTGAVSIEIKKLDLAGIDAHSFGDGDETSLSMVTQPRSK